MVNDLDSEASGWVVALAQEPPGSAPMRARFERWRAQGARHEVAYQRALLAWEQADRLSALRPAGGDIDADLFASQPMPAIHSSRRWLVLGAIAASVLVVVLWGGLRSRLESAPPLEFASALGDQRTVVLADGSQIELNTNSRVRVQFSAAQRNVTLLQGEALFIVAHNAVRPFVVEANGFHVRAVGTAFDVRERPGGAEITVTEGVVRVARRGEAAAGGPMLAAGSRGLFSPGSNVLQKLSSAQVQQYLAWRNGVLAFDGNSLGEVANEFNRYNSRQLAVLDPSLAGLRVGGYFRADDVDAFVRSTSRLFGLKARLVGSRLILERAARTVVPEKQQSLVNK